MTVLTIQSQVCFGHVGNSAAAFALQRAGIDVIAVPTALFARHPGHGRPAGRVLPADEIAAMTGQLLAEGRLDGCGAAITGYMGSLETLKAVHDLVKRLKARNEELLWALDPVCGDQAEGYYVPRDIANYLRDEAIGDADILFPNRFELAHLSDRNLERGADVTAAAQSLVVRGPKLVICTSANIRDGSETAVETLAVTEGEAWIARTSKLDGVPKGSGDLLAALFVANLLHGHGVASALGRTVGSVQGILERSIALGRDELALVAAQSEILDPNTVAKLERAP